MNLLAHALLAYASFPDAEGGESVGSIMADYFSGERLDAYPEAIARGIAHHRLVDAFTDAHPAFISARGALAAEAPPHSGGILVDLFWDNVLASAWEEYGEPASSLDLRSFNQEVYERIVRSRDHWSPSFKRVAPWLVSMDWLGAYAREEGIDGALRRIAAYLPHGAPLADCARLLAPHRPALERTLRAFWPDVLAFACDAAIGLRPRGRDARLGSGGCG